MRAFAKVIVGGIFASGLCLLLCFTVASQTAEVLNDQAKVAKVLEDSGRFFKDGIVEFKANRRSESGEKFDKSVEAFLLSTLNIQHDAKLQTCYAQLIETIYRIEFPFKAQYPEIRTLVSKCQWKWNSGDFLVADAITDTVKGLASKRTSLSEDEARLFFEKQHNAKLVLDAAQSLVENRRVTFREILKKKKRGESVEAELEKAGASLDAAVDEYIKARTKVNRLSVEWTESATAGFEKQVYERSPLDELARFEPSRQEPNRLNAARYSRPQNYLAGIKVVKAHAGDTVSKLATRHNANPTEVAKYNGLLTNSILGAGREVKIPSTASSYSLASGTATASGKTTALRSSIPFGPKPTQFKGGRVGIVMTYFEEVLHDPYSMRIVRWSPIVQSYSSGLPCWRLTVKYRAKNLMGAYVLSERAFCIRNDKIISTSEL